MKPQGKGHKIYLVVDEFGIKNTKQQDSEHLIVLLKDK